MTDPWHRGTGDGARRAPAAHVDVGMFDVPFVIRVRVPHASHVY